MPQNWENLSDPIFDHAAARPDAPAVVEGGTVLGYAELASLVGKASVYLHEHGIAAGERIGLALNNSADHIILLFAAFRLGAVPIELSVEDKPDALAATARKYGIRTIFTEAHVPPPPGIERIRLDMCWRDRIAAKSGDRRSAASGDELHLIALTTGTTGAAKGVVTTHRQSIARFEVQSALFGTYWLREPRGGTLVLTANIRFGAFFRFLLSQLMAGGVTVVLPDCGRQPIELARAIASWDDAIAFVTANMCRLFIEAAPSEGLLFPRARMLVAGGMPLAAGEKQAMIAHVTPNFFDGYGTTGFGTISLLSPADMVAKADSVGRPAAGVAVEIVDEHGRSLPAGATGRIRCRSLSSSLGQCSEDLGPGAEFFADGWYYPGDVGFLDDAGYLHIKSRVGETFRRSGTDVFAPEVEAVLASHSAVAEAAVVAGKTLGDRDEIVAFIVKSGALDHDELARFCRARLTSAQIPDRVYYTEALPRIADGKLNRVRLEELAAGQTAQSSSGA
ncbi:MAG TPA: class I adenylate-forming enzyme family protein [Stellaceae bacterium]|nr:class I adenylate-forming enzyme family protein [Stellaceae bacterium]